MKLGVVLVALHCIAITFVIAQDCPVVPGPSQTCSRYTTTCSSDRECNLRHGAGMKCCRNPKLCEISCVRVKSRPKLVCPQTPIPKTTCNGDYQYTCPTNGICDEERGLKCCVNPGACLTSCVNAIDHTGLRCPTAQNVGRCPSLPDISCHSDGDCGFGDKCCEEPCATLCRKGIR